MNWEYLGKDALPPGTVVFGKTIFSMEVETWRTKVPGGWLVLTTLGSSSAMQSTTFYPDPAHEWDGQTLA